MTTRRMHARALTMTLLVLSILTSVAVATSVAAGGLILSAPKPVPGSRVAVANPTISINASSTTNIGGTPNFRIDGTSYTGSFTPLRVGGRYDLTQGTASYTRTLSDGAHDVTATVSDTGGNTALQAWSFFIAVPPTVSSRQPADGATVKYTTPPTVQATFADNGTIATASMTLDGKPFGTWNAAAKSVGGTVPTPFPDGSHRVTATATDTVGASVTTSWGFTSLNQPKGWFSSPQPAAGATISGASPFVSIDFNDYYSITTATMTIDGAAVPAAFTHPNATPTAGRLTYQCPLLADGLHTVTVVEWNRLGGYSTYAWSFTVASPPSLSAPRPADGSTVSTRGPEISILATDNTGVATAAASIDGTSVPASYDLVTSRVRLMPPAQLENDRDHSVWVRVTDDAGNATVQTWTFRVQIYADMQGTSCTSCHTTYPAAHPMSNCDACHGGDRPVADCRACHSAVWGAHSPAEFDSTAGHIDPVGPYACTRCHAPEYSDKVPQHPADVTDLHNTTQAFDTCRTCHVSSLTVEHNRRTDSHGEPLTCGSCHASTDPDVKAAIAAKDTRCSTCHADWDHTVQHATQDLDENCRTCHENNLLTEHVSNTKTQSRLKTCETCHSSTDFQVAAAIVRGDMRCTACHSDAHGISFGSIAIQDVPLYTGYSFSPEQDASIWAGESWVPGEFATGKLLLSDRRADVAASDVEAFYQAQMTTAGWTATTDSRTSSYLRMSFSKGARRMRLYFYSGEVADPGAPAVGGFRIAILYN